GGGPAQRLLEEAKGVLQREPGEVGLPDLAEVWQVRSRPPEPQRRWGFGGARQAVDCEPDERSPDEWARLASPPCRMVLRGCMQPTPGLDTDGAILGISGRPRSGGRGPRGWMVTANLGPGPRWSSGWRLRGRVGIEAPPRTQAHQEAEGQIIQGQAELERVVASIEGEDRQASSARERTCLPKP